jgi:GAF domain-containing protein
MKDEDLTYKFFELSSFLDQRFNLDENLHELTVLAADILNVKNCSIMLLKDDEPEENVTLRIFAHSGYLPAAANEEAVNIKEGVSGYVASTGESLFVEDIDKSRFAALKRGRYKSKGFISTPISIHDKVIGVINANTPKDKPNINKKDLDILKIIALLISKSIQVIQLQSLLKSRYAQFAVAPVEDLQSLSVSQNTGSVAKILAKSFYHEMSRAGFGSDHMITTATEILSLLSEKLQKHKVRADRS